MRSSLVNEPLRKLVSCRDSGYRVLTMPSPKPDPDPVRHSTWTDPQETRLKNIEAQLERLATPLPASSIGVQSKPGSWLKLHTHWWPLPALLIALIVLLWGNALLSKLYGMIFNSFFDERLGSQASVLVINSHIDDKLKQSIEDIHKMQISVEKISLRLDLQDKAALKSQAFKNALPVLADTLKQSAKLGLSVPANVNAALQQNLQTADTKAPGYWDATSQFINYRSQEESPGLAALTLTLLPCYAKTPRVTVKIGTPSYQNPPADYTNCILDIDADIPDDIWNYISHQRPQRDRDSLLIADSIVRYNGGPISERTIQLLGFSFFRNCLFVITLHQEPPKPGEELSRALLASDSLKDLRLTNIRN
jgi:hypothetical protein